MTPEQATAIREHLVKEMNANGFAAIVTAVNARLEESYGEMNFQRTPRSILSFFLLESVDVLENLSNDNYEEIINRINRFITGNDKIERISVELLNQGESTYFDLNDLPDYQSLIRMFKEIISELSNEE